MKFLTGYFCCANLHSALVLQQVTRRRGKLPIVFAFVWEAGKDVAYRDADDGDVAREMTEWFYEQALPACSEGKEVACVDAVQKMFASKAGEVTGEFAALFAVGVECFYAWRGSVELHLLNLCFNRLHRKCLTCWSETFSMERAQIESEVGLLLGSGNFFAQLPEQLLKECLAVETLKNCEQVERHLREASEEVLRCGTEEFSVVLVVVQGG